jgi:tetratricopeptide (TPR) repeat protein
MSRLGQAALAVGLAACGGPQAPELPPLYDDLGTLHSEITTSAPLAQQYFDQGLRLQYAFNYGAAIASFREAARLDPSCAMCYWGIAMSHGPNINASMDSASGTLAYEAIQEALAHAGAVSEREQALIRAMATRYAALPPSPRAFLDTAYARAMQSVADRHPDDDDAQVLYAEAVMLLSPWDYWTDQREPRAGTETILSRLGGVLGRHPDHPGACHFYIHAVEAAFPERALPCAERLPQLMPGAGHVVHMPAHIYIRVGRYADAIETNLHAVHADEGHLADMNPDGVYRQALVPHNRHFISFAATLAGRKELAISAARELAAAVDPEKMRQPGLHALQHFLMAPARALVRFGEWDLVLREPAPPEGLPYPMGLWHWARGVAFARLGVQDSAALELEALERLAADPALAGVTLWDINAADALLPVATHALAGELAAARGAPEQAITRLEQAMALEDALTYDEPPQWELPIRHLLGALLLEAGRPAEAEARYREDLDRFPENGWSLFGLAQALEAQGRAGAEEVRARFDEAWRAADVSLTSSRF